MAKHVEILLSPRLDEGSIPSSSTFQGAKSTLYLFDIQSVNAGFILKWGLNFGYFGPYYNKVSERFRSIFAPIFAPILLPLLPPFAPTVLHPFSTPFPPVESVAPSAGFSSLGSSIRL